MSAQVVVFVLPCAEPCRPGGHCSGTPARKEGEVNDVHTSVNGLFSRVSNEPVISEGQHAMFITTVLCPYTLSYCPNSAVLKYIYVIQL